MSETHNTEYGNYWINHATKEWYEEIYNKVIYIHENFKEWLKGKNIKSVCEVGAGTGNYSEFFNNIEYTGIDLCPLLRTDNPKHRVIIGNVMDVNSDREYELVFSHSVIDHVPNPEEFIEKCLSLSKKYVYITAYIGYFPDKDEHDIIWNNNSSCYFNWLSIRKIRLFLDQKNLKYNINNLDGKSTVVIIEK